MLICFLLLVSHPGHVSVQLHDTKQVSWDNLASNMSQSIWRLKDILKKHKLFFIIILHILRNTITFQVPWLVGSQLHGAVAEGGVGNLDHLAAWGSRDGPCVFVTPQRAPRPVSQLKLLLQERIKLKRKVNCSSIKHYFNSLPLNPMSSSPSWQAAESSSSESTVSSPVPC